MPTKLEWVNVYVGHDPEDFIIAGRRFGEYEARLTGEIVTLDRRSDDSRPTKFSVIEIDVDGVATKCAVNEILNCVYSLYIFQEKPIRFEETKRVDAVRAYLTQKARGAVPNGKA